MEVLLARLIVAGLAVLAAFVAAHVADTLRKSQDDSFLGFLGFTSCLGAIGAALVIAYTALTVTI